ncbi:kelch repeat-containing protein [Maribacter sp.]|uniref:kelch repeat-containing protein n=1 Tax=Maribacter sp. TaxID=1897614 RepID=UPI0025C2C863|nr:kelch repeat-containing protein [Maribacter sp.]
MKTFKIVYLALLALVFVSCDKDELIEDQTSIPKGGDALALKFEVKTQQDQMGDFAENAMIEFQDKIWSYGGVNDYGATGGHFGWNSDNGINWISLPIEPSTLTSFRRGHTITFFKDELYLIGGKDNTENPYGDIWKSNDGITWTTVHAIAPFGEIPEHATLVLNDKMYVIAGNSTTTNTEVWSTINGRDWIQETTNAFSGRAGQKGIVFNNAMYIVGGEDISGRKLNEIWTSTNGSSWSQINFIHFPGRNAHTVSLYDNKVWVIGGKDASIDYNSEIWYSENMTDWTIYTEARPSDEGINSHTILNYSDKLWLFGGYQNDGTGTSELRGEITTIEIE